jgi:hypothetical protein
MLRAAVAILAVLAVLPAAAAGHAERATFYPDHDAGSVPKRDTSRPDEVVCKRDSAKRIRRSFSGRKERARLGLLARCRFQNIQAAVNAAKSGDRIAVMPGRYLEKPSRAVPVSDPKCAGDEYWEASGDNHQADGRVPTYLHQYDCPNARNLIAVIGDSLDDDRVCDRKCRLTIEGFGRRPRDVVVVGDRRKPDVIRADRADGFQLRNMTFEQGAYNNVNVVETNGFFLKDLVTRYASHYGILTFTTDNGVYDHIEAYGSGDSGVYPGSGPERHCADYGIQVRRVNAYGNTLAASGTAGNGTWLHHNDFHDNAAGLANDSFAPGHPGMPQDCSKWTNNRIHSNNVNFFDDDNEAYCNSTPFEKRRRKTVCPVFQVVVGVGFMFYGVNDNIVARNYIYDQWRNGVRQFAVPAPARGETDPSKLYDTSHGNRYVDNWFGVRPDGTPDPNGIDVYWDEQGMRNCWEGNHTAKGVALTSDPATLPDCASGGSTNPVGNTAKLAQDLPCIQWHPQNNPDPAGCDWFTTPAEPGTGARGAAFASAPLFAAGAAPVAAPGESAQGGLTWDGDPELIAPAALPDDRILHGRLRNTSPVPLRLDGAAAVLRDDAGRTVRGSVSYAYGFSHGLYGPAVGPNEPMPDFLATRLGTAAVVQPGATVPFTVAWRRGTEAGAPVSADLGAATVALPATR